MRDWLIDYGSWGLAPFGLLGMIVVGQKRTWGWVVSMATQALWAFYAIGTGQYGFLIGTLSYFAVYLNNWVLWTTGRSLYDRLRRRTRPAPADPVREPCPSQSRYGDLCAHGLGHTTRHGDPARGASGINWDDPVCPRCPHLASQHDREGCTVTIPQTEDPDFGPVQTCPCCERRTQ